jgi:MYXO-CTERM domain-containing protein
MQRPLALFLLVAFAFINARADAQCVPSQEVCDGADNDCDDEVDNPPFADAPSAGQARCWDLPGNCCTFSSLNWCPPSGATCSGTGVLSSPCAAGTITCDLGAWTCAGVQRPLPEVCDGLDNNCDGTTDDGTEAGTSCTSGLGACEAMGVLECSVTGASCSADPGLPGTELCGNGVDDDCNGMVDEGFTIGASCTVGVGACLATGMYACDAGSEVCDATEGTPAASETCDDGVDDDCDGMIDNGCTPDAGVPDDAGVASDAGMVDDAGTTDDAGMIDDASVATDARVLEDAGADASTPDGGGSSGCSCRAGASSAPVGAPAMALGLLAVLLARRCRRTGV